jgi:hypothetical protein
MKVRASVFSAPVVVIFAVPVVWFIDVPDRGELFI